MVSVNGRYEAPVINNQILQSAFLAEERDHPEEKAWKRSNIPCRVKNILKQLKEQTVPHTVLSGQKAHISPCPNASLEAQRLIDYTVEQRKYFCLNLALHCFIFLVAVLTLYRLFKGCYTDYIRNATLVEILAIQTVLILSIIASFYVRDYVVTKNKLFNLVYMSTKLLGIIFLLIVGLVLRIL